MMELLKRLNVDWGVRRGFICPKVVKSLSSRARYLTYQHNFYLCFLSPARVTNRLEKIFRDFLWGGLEVKKKNHLIKWNKICTPLSCDGLGVRKLRTSNNAHWGKWLC